MGAQVDSMLLPTHAQQQVMPGGVAQHVAVPAGPPAAAARPAPTPRAKKAKLESTANAAAAAAASSGSSFSALMAAAAPPALPASPSASVAGKKASVPAGEVRSAYVQRMSTFWQDQLAETQSQSSIIARRGSSIGDVNAVGSRVDPLLFVLFCRVCLSILQALRI
jgi:hypothetical protein